jgi:hypothetical protein
MTTEEIAAKFARKPGYKLVDFRDAALPVWLIDIDALVIASKKVPLVEEFILRSVSSGLAEPAEIGAFLGLDQRYVVRCLGKLLATDQIHYLPNTGHSGPVVTLTERGRKTVQESKIDKARLETLTYLYDGITRRLVPMVRSVERLIRPFQVKDWGLFEVPALPGRPPLDDEFKIDDLNTVLPKLAKKEKRIRQVLSVAAVGQRRRRFREAVLLVYKSTSNNDVQVSFISTEGRALLETDAAFAKKDGVKRLGISEQLKAASRENAAIFKAKEEAAVLKLSTTVSEQEREKVVKAAVEVAQIEQRVREAQQQLRDPQSSVEKQRLETELETLKKERADREVTITAHKTRLIEVFEHPIYFDRALSTARESLMIISPWITDQAMHHNRVEAIKKLLAANVAIYIGHGIDPNDPTQKNKRRNEDTQAFRRLDELSKKHTNLRLVRLGDTHAKVLVKDRDFAIVGSFNWMSFKGDPTQGFREELSTLQTAPEFVDQLFTRYLKRFDDKDKAATGSTPQRKGNSRQARR